MTACSVCSNAQLATSFGDLCGACALMAALSESRDRVGDYERFHLLGEGAMGLVYMAKHVTSDEVVALKLAKPELLAHPGGAGLFRRQAKLESALSHPNIVHVQGAGVHEGRPYLVMPLMEGGTLAEPENAARFASPRARLELVLSLARALQFAHERGVLHCDLKPENILFDSELQPRVSDFGMARSLDLAGIADGPSGGTRGWMSPEQARGEALTTASDVFALGILLHWLATGQLPFADDAQEPAPPLRAWSPELSWGLEAVTHKALQKEPALRYPSAVALVHDLERLASEQTIRGQLVPPWGRAWHWSQRHPGARNAIFLLLPCFALAALLMAQSQREELRRDALDRNAYAASGQAAAVLYQLRDYAALIELAAADPAVRGLVNGPRRLPAPNPNAGADPCSTQVALEDASPLARYAEKFDTLVVVDVNGCARARVAPGVVSLEYIRTSQIWRNYFSAASEDATRPARSTQVRKAYRSSVSQMIKFAVSTPLFEGEHWVGVVSGSITAAATLGLPRTRRTEIKDQLTVLVGPVEGERSELGRGGGEYTLLVHPGLGLGQKATLDSAVAARLARAFHAPTETQQFELGTAPPEPLRDYVDPLWGGRWLAAVAPVGGTGYVVVVQARDEVAIRASDGLHRFGLALALGSGCLLAVWVGFFSWRRSRERAR